MDGWHRATLNVPTKIAANDETGKEAPIPPPRKKRPSQEVPIQKQPPGFKDLFGHNISISRRSSVDSALHMEKTPTVEKKLEAQQRRTQSASVLTAKQQIEQRPVVSIPQPLVISSANPSPDRIENGLQRKVSRVGNKKSDKFFGENLSDCLSDEPIDSPDSADSPVETIGTVLEPSSQQVANAPLATTKDEIDIFIERNVKLQDLENVVKDGVVEKSPVIIKDDIVIVTTNPETRVKEIDVDAGKASEAADIHSEKRGSLDKKAEFLMAMLDDKDLTDSTSTTTDETVVAAPRRKHSKQQELERKISRDSADFEPVVKVESKALAHATVDQSVDDDDYYKGREPVEEPIIVPKRKIYGHVCDGDHLHDHLHHHYDDEVDGKSKDEQTPPPTEPKESAIKVVSSAPIACPKKPKRDFALYEKSKQASSSSPSSPEEPQPVKRNIRKKQRSSASFESLPKAETECSPEKPLPPRPVPVRLRRGKSADEKVDSMLKKCKSSSSFLTQELMNQIVERVYGFQDPYSQDHGYDDGTSKVTPSSKLTTRKISTSKRDNNVPSIQEDIAEDDHHVKKTVPIPAEEKIEKLVNVETKAAPTTSPAGATATGSHNVVRRKSSEETLSFIELEKLHAHPGHKRIPAPASAPAPTVMQTISQPHIAEDIEKILNAANPDDEAISHVLDDIYKSNNNILEDFQKYLDDNLSSDDPETEQLLSKSQKTVEKIVEKHENDSNAKAAPEQKEVVVEVQTTVATDSDGGVKKLTFVNVNGERRDSIVDVDQWFLRHNEFGDQPRRGSESNISTGYDTKKLFPFGKMGKGTHGATEFFETKNQSKSADNIPEDVKETSDEHSTLLKYLNEKL